MAQAGDTVQRRETIETSGAPKAATSGHSGSYLGLAIASLILIAMVFLQNAASSIY